MTLTSMVYSRARDNELQYPQSYSVTAIFESAFTAEILPAQRTSAAAGTDCTIPMTTHRTDTYSYNWFHTWFRYLNKMCIHVYWINPLKCLMVTSTIPSNSSVNKGIYSSFHMTYQAELVGKRLHLDPGALNCIVWGIWRYFTQKAGQEIY